MQQHLGGGANSSIVVTNCFGIFFFGKFKFLKRNKTPGLIGPGWEAHMYWDGCGLPHLMCRVRTKDQEWCCFGNEGPICKVEGHHGTQTPRTIAFQILTISKELVIFCTATIHLRGEGIP